MRATAAALTLALLASLALLSCSSPSAPTTYERIVIETFSPDGSVTADTYIDLFDSNGDPDADDPWTGNDTADAIAYDDDGNDSLFTGMSRVDYSGGLASGTYYIRVRGRTISYGIDDFYAIRVLSLQLGDSIPAYPTLAFAAKPDSEEVDDNPTSGGIPGNPVSIDTSTPLSRTLYSNGTDPEIDWFELVLP